MFAGKDFLSMEPPPNYRPGIGRGALGFSTRGNIGAPTQAHFSRDDKAAAQVWASVDKRHKPHQPETHDTARFEDVPLDAWLAMPQAADMTMRTKRLRTERNDSRRTYAVPDSLLEDIGVDYAAMTRQDPTNPKGWINYARQLQQMNQFKKARATIDKGCAKCNDPSVWAAAVDQRQGLDEKRQVVARAVTALPGSLHMWTKALELESEPANQLAVLHKALEHHPDQTDLWLRAIPLEPDHALQLEMASTATTFCAAPELYLLWYRLSGQVQHLDMGLGRCASPLLWLERSRLPDNCAEPPDGDWYEALAVFEGIVPPGLLSKLKLDPERVPKALQEEAYRARAEDDPTYLLPWSRIASDPRPILEEAVTKLGVEAWEAYYEHDPAVLERAFEAFPDQFRQRYFDKFGLEPQTEAEFYARADQQQSLEVCRAGLLKFPNSSRLYSLAHKLGAPDALQDGLSKAPSAELWQQQIEAEPLPPKKRLLIARALKAFSVEPVWLLKVELDPQYAEQAVKACPSSGKLWSRWLEQLPPREKKRRFREALEKTGNSREVQDTIVRFKAS